MSESEPSSTGLDANLAGCLTYLLGFVTGIVFLVIEKRSNYVRFHAVQSILTFGSLMVLQVAAAVLPLVGGLLSMLIPPVSLILWVLLMVKALQGQRFKLPYLGDLAEEQARLPGA
jgi:uncharacterized membrane protein